MLHQSSRPYVVPTELYVRICLPQAHCNGALTAKSLLGIFLRSSPKRQRQATNAGDAGAAASWAQVELGTQTSPRMASALSQPGLQNVIALAPPAKTVLTKCQAKSIANVQLLCGASEGVLEPFAVPKLDKIPP